MNLGIVLRQIRKKKNIKQYELSKLAHIDSSLISNIELNKRHPSLKQLEKICNVLGVNIEEVKLLSLDTNQIFEEGSNLWKELELIKIQTFFKISEAQ